ncbi:hypothetical protein QWY28_21915 [Nocardioides sp. SOB77]|uniref:Uncharacterized protein n=1 Tax=Nocardioides oceani TaxID=3058369 RepID=A0ABT8FLX9_9ACTN|nr:hypothetical protein [Nocardioides oceani]MDN4175634.1 hypothetical protein [Nocardioides oceani]
MSAFRVQYNQTTSVTVLEFWPDYGPGSVWTEAGGVPVDLGRLGVHPDLVAHVGAAWNGAYSDDKVPMDSLGDSAWLRGGKHPLGETRSALGAAHRVVVRAVVGREPT